MKQHRFYRIINVLVLPFAAFMGLNALTSLFSALMNPAILLVTFIIVCVPLYAFSANYFYNKGIKLQQPCKPSLKDFIKVNAIVSLIFALIMVVGTLLMLALLNDPVLFEQMKARIIATMPDAAPTFETDLRKVLQSSIAIFLPFSVLLIIHIIITFRLLGRYKQVFNASTKDPE